MDLFGEERQEQKKKQTKRIVFKSCEQNQMTMLPEELGSMILENDIVRVIDNLIEKVPMAIFAKVYKGGGTSSYSPKMMTKIIILSYLEGIYSSRKIAKQLRRDIRYMWISGKKQIDFRTINNFRLRIKEIIEEIFVEIVKMLMETGHVELTKYFVDGTKIEANANKYSYVWKKNTKRYKAQAEENIRKRVKEIMDISEEIDKEEDAKYGEKEDNSKPAETTKIEAAAKQINEKIKRKKERKIERIKKEIEEKLEPKVNKYEEQEKILRNRNSYSKTDHDATFLRMKDGRLLAGYNIIIGSENQYVTNYTVTQNAADTVGFKENIKKFKDKYGKYPKEIFGDAGFGGEENYDFMEEEKIGGILKNNMTDYEKTKKYREDKYKKENFKYDEVKNEYTCPEGRTIRYIGIQHKKTSTGYETESKKYECESCKWCRKAKECKKSKTNKTLTINENLDRHKEIVREKMKDEELRRLLKRRSYDVETVFGDMKENGKFRRFRLRGKEKVSLEIGLWSLGHNIKKFFQSLLKDTKKAMEFGLDLEQKLVVT
jgi:transposase